MFLDEAEKQEIQEAVAPLLGLLDRLQGRGDSCRERPIRRLRDELLGFCARALGETCAGEREADAELLRLGLVPQALRAEDFGHQPYRFPFNHQER